MRKTVQMRATEVTSNHHAHCALWQVLGLRFHAVHTCTLLYYVLLLPYCSDSLDLFTHTRGSALQDDPNLDSRTVLLIFQPSHFIVYLL